MGLDPFTSAFGLDEYTTKSGKRKKEAEEQALDIGKQQFQISKELYGESKPARQQGLSSLTDFLQTGNIPTAYSGFPTESAPRLNNFLDTGELPTALDTQNSTAASRDILEQQFGRARENTISQAPALGGGLGADLTSLEAQRALGITAIESQALNAENALKQKLYGVGLDYGAQDVQAQRDLRQQLFAQSLGVGQQNAGFALSGLAGGANTYTNIASLALQESLEKQKRAQDTANSIIGFGKGGA